MLPPVSDFAERLKAGVRSVSDFPKPGILFRDLTPVLEDADLFRSSVELLAEHSADLEFSKIAGLDARGFIFGSALACHLGRGFMPVRKKGKLPGPVLTHAYELEYGSAAFEIRRDGLAPGEKVLIVDDLLATGGSASAAAALIRASGGIPVAALFVIELEGLGGRDALGELPARSLVRFPA
jgi:adenine phosphoribosyltransferase